MRAISQLVKIDTPAAMDAVMMGLQTNNYEVERFAGGRLRKIKNHASLLRLCEHATGHKHPHVRAVLTP